MTEFFLLTTAAQMTALPWPLVLVGCCAVLFGVIGVLAVLIALKQPSSLKPKDQPGPAAEPAASGIADNLSATMPVKPMLPVSFYPVGVEYQRQQFTISPDEWVVLGSGETADIRLQPPINKKVEICARHCRLMITETELRASPLDGDMAVNGVPVHEAPALMNSGELMRIGNQEYRIIWHDAKKESDEA